MIKPDEIIRTRRRSIALILQPDGRLVVRAPLRATNAQIQAFIHQKTAWVLKKQVIIQLSPAAVAAHQFTPGESFWYLGTEYPLQLVDMARVVLALEAGVFKLKLTAMPRARQVFTAWYRQQAQQVLSERVEKIAEKNGFTYRQVKVTSARTRWGSCSARGVISFPWRLVMAPLEMIDYVVVHELVHTIEHNHRAGFWQRVGAILPDYQHRRAWFKHNELTLTL